MFGFKWLNSFRKGLALVLAALLFAGCATQKVQFTSIPPGATVVVGKKQGITPCTLKISEKETHATFSLPSGEERVLPIHGLDSDFEETVEASGKLLGGALMLVGGAVFIVGGAVFIAAAVLDDDDEDDLWSDTGDEDHSNDELLGYGAAIAVSGGLLFGLGTWIYPDDHEAVLHVNFNEMEQGGKQGAKEDTLYEDPGYGARRLKKATP